MFPSPLVLAALLYPICGAGAVDDKDLAVSSDQGYYEKGGQFEACRIKDRKWGKECGVTGSETGESEGEGHQKGRREFGLCFPYSFVITVI